MYPFLVDGSILQVDPECDTFGVGDIVVFRTDDKLTAHRIVGKAKSGYYEKGDYRLEGSLISRDQILGRVLSARSPTHHVALSRDFRSILFAFYSGATGIVAKISALVTKRPVEQTFLRYRLLKSLELVSRCLLSPTHRR